MEREFSLPEFQELGEKLRRQGLWRQTHDNIQRYEEVQEDGQNKRESLKDAYENFTHLIQTGTEALDVQVDVALTSLSVTKQELITPIPLQSRFPPGDVRLRVTRSCEKMNSLIREWMESPDFSRGIIGPTGTGKSYALLYNYLLLRPLKRYVILYLNNPEQLLNDRSSLVKQLVFCFGIYLADIEGIYNDFAGSPVKDMNFQQAQQYLSEIDNLTTLEDSTLLTLLWALYLCVSYGKVFGIDFYIKVLVLLNSYCASKNRDFVLFFDQYNYLYREGVHFEIRQKWLDIVQEDNNCFVKVLWLASQNNDFHLSSNCQAFQLIQLYDKEDLLTALVEYIVTISDPEVKDQWTRNVKSIRSSLDIYTKRHPLEVYELLKTEGNTIENKWQKYSERRLKELLKKARKFRHSKIFQKDLYYALLPVVDFKGRIEGYLDFLDAIEAKENNQTDMCILPGCIDWGLMYYNQAKGTLNSLSGIASIVIKHLLFMKKTSQVREMCSWLYNTVKYPGVLYERMVVSTLLENRHDCFFKLAHRHPDFSKTRFVSARKPLCVTLQFEHFETVDCFTILLQRSIEYFNKLAALES